MSNNINLSSIYPKFYQNIKPNDNNKAQWAAGLLVAGGITGYKFRESLIADEIKNIPNPTQEVIKNIKKSNYKYRSLWLMIPMFALFYKAAADMLFETTDSFLGWLNYYKNKEKS